MCECVHVSMSTTCIPGAHTGQKKGIRSLGIIVTCSCQLPDVGALN